MGKSKTLAIDFDGVIHRYSKGYQDGEAYDVPMEGARNSIRKFLDQGWNIIIHTTRTEDQVMKWFSVHMPEFVWAQVQSQSATSADTAPVAWCTGISYVQKPMAQFYIDDRALRFTNWHDIERYII